MDNKIKQLRKGILELAILGCLYHESHYGYSLVKTLSGEGDITLTEGTIYPILSRLAKEGLIRSEWIASQQGPPRKYYSVTAGGKKTFEVLNGEFKKLAELIVDVKKEPEKKGQEKERKKILVKKEREDDK
ncbi:MAG: PadR family transcriptional regulator [bacterium]